MDKEYLETVAEYLEDAKTANEVRQYLGKLLVEFEKELRCKNKEYIKYVRCIQKLLRKVSKELSYQKAFVCGQYFEKFGNLISIYQDEAEQHYRTMILSKPLCRNIFSYLYENGMVEVDKIVSCFADKASVNETIRQLLEKMIEANLVLYTHTSDFEYCELTPDGYSYYRTYLQMEES